MTTPQRRRRIATGMAGIAGMAGFSLIAAACGGGTTDPVATGVVAVADTADATGDIVTVSAAEGAAARQARDAAVGGAAGRLASPESGLTLAANDAMPIDCGTGGAPYVPTAEEIAAANADTDALAATLDTYGIAYERIVDDLGFAYIETDYTDVVAQSVIDSFWHDRYPPQPIPAEELDRIRAENDAIAAALDAIGATYTRQSDDTGWEWIEWDYENADAQAAVNDVYAELYPPVPPSPEELERIQTENDALAAAFDAAGIAYTRMADDAGWEWIEWDYEDPAVAEAVQAVYDELYPVEPGDGVIEPCPLVDPVPIDGEIMPLPAEDAPAVGPDVTVGGDSDEVAADEGGVAGEPIPGDVIVEPVDGGGTIEPDPGTVGDPVEIPIGEAPTDGDVSEGDVGDGGDIAVAPPAETVAGGDGVGADGERVAVEGELSIAPDSGFTDAQIAQRDADVAALAQGFEAAGVTFEVVGESPWASVLFDIADPAAVQVVADVLAARG